MDLVTLLSRHEGKTLEFKRDLSSPEGVLKAIVAFANTSGGVIVLGVEDGTKKVKGVRDVGPDWLDAFASFLRLPVMAVFLVMVGITCLILELKMPGVGLPGVISAVCFVLFFWSHSQLNGQMTCPVLSFSRG